jgi:hypothetical protein
VLGEKVENAELPKLFPAAVLLEEKYEEDGSDDEFPDPNAELIDDPIEFNKDPELLFEVPELKNELLIIYILPKKS